MISWNFLYVKLFSVYFKWLVVSKQRFFCARARTNIRSLNFQIRPGQKPATSLSCKQHSRQLWFFLTRRWPADCSNTLPLEFHTKCSRWMGWWDERQIWQRTLSMFSIKISFINNLQLKVHVFTFPRNSKLRYSLWPELFSCDKNMVYHLRPHPNVSHSTRFIFQNCFLMKPNSPSNNKKNHKKPAKNLLYFCKYRINTVVFCSQLRQTIHRTFLESLPVAQEKVAELPNIYETIFSTRKKFD